MSHAGFSVVILAAGKATRFKSERPKVLHRLAGRPLGEYVVRAAAAAKPEEIYLVVGHGSEEVRKTFARPGVTFIEQKERLGTGHALITARAELERSASAFVLVLVGDAPLLGAEALRALVESHAASGAAATVLTARLEKPTGYGRIVRAGSPGAAGDRVSAIVEEKIATPEQKKIQEINSGILCFTRAKLVAHLGELSNQNAQREYLLTDLVGIFNAHGLKVGAFPVDDPRQVLGVNDRVELAAIEKILRLRKTESLMRDGVTIVDPAVTYVDEDVEVAPDTVIEPGVSLLGGTRVGRGSVLYPCSTISNSILGDRVTVRHGSVIYNSEIASDATIGPFAHLRDGAVIEQKARIGNFVEVKKSRVGRGSKASHLTYLGDATLGADVNIGAGTITCNYDGKKKNLTVIEDGCFIGSGTMLVAPVRVSKGSTVGAGSTITEDVPPQSLALGRARQVNKDGWARTRGQAETTTSIAVREVGSVTVIDVGGRLTHGEAVTKLRQELVATRNAGRTRVLINLAATDYVDSTGMGELVAAMKSFGSAGGQLKVSGITHKVLALFETANLVRLLEIHPHESAALASFGGDK